MIRQIFYFLHIVWLACQVSAQVELTEECVNATLTLAWSPADPANYTYYYFAPKLTIDIPNAVFENDTLKLVCPEEQLVTTVEITPAASWVSVTTDPLQVHAFTNTALSVDETVTINLNASLPNHTAAPIQLNFTIFGKRPTKCAQSYEPAQIVSNTLSTSGTYTQGDNSYRDYDTGTFAVSSGVACKSSDLRYTTTCIATGYNYRTPWLFKNQWIRF
jgi:hypothetical protein